MLSAIWWVVVAWVSIGLLYFALSAPFRWKSWRKKYPENKDLAYLLLGFAFFGPTGFFMAAYYYGKKLLSGRA